MAAKMEMAALDILKDEVTSLEDWIKAQQKEVDEAIKKIEGAYETNRQSLLDTGHFTEEDVKNQLAEVQKKAEAKKEINSNYAALLARASSIYEWCISNPF